MTKKPSSDLQILNQRRWQETGSLLRTSSLLLSLHNRYPNINSQAIFAVIKSIEDEVHLINCKYTKQRRDIKDKRTRDGKRNDSNS